MAEPTILELFGLKPVKPYTNSKVIPVNNPCPSLLYGLELEIENASFDWETSFFAAKEDGSLRNRGVEFISLPTTYSIVAHKLREFFTAHPLEHTVHPDGEAADYSNYSDRTSIHVHTNVQNLTLTQLSVLCLVYEVFERLLFHYIGNDRDKNIFCVPWYETTLNHDIVTSFKKGNTDSIRRWQKYTALNLLPISSAGSIEWRHMHGNNDVEFILTWLRLIGHIYLVALNHSFDEVCEKFLTLNTTSQYNQMLEWVFQQETGAVANKGYTSAMEEGVLNFKYSYINANNKNKPALTTNSLLDALDRIREMQANTDDQIARPVQLPEVGNRLEINRQIFNNNTFVTSSAAGQNNWAVFDEVDRIPVIDTIGGRT